MNRECWALSHIFISKRYYLEKVFHFFFKFVVHFCDAGLKLVNLVVGLQFFILL